jgi:hypothetical protein
MSASDEEWFLWDSENGEQPTGASETLLSRLRSMSGIWQSLGVRAENTYVLYQPGSLTVAVDIVDRGRHLIIGTLRVDHLGAFIYAAWIAPSLADRPDITQADPRDGVTFAVEPPASENGIDETVAWLEAQLRRPVQFLQCSQSGKTIATLYILADTGRGLCESGPRSFNRNPRTASSVIQIRP